MRIVALVSGGKDSCYNMMLSVADGHEIVALANLQPKEADELDSFMYQTVGHQAVDYYAQAMGLPLYRGFITGIAKNQGLDYEETTDDEVEDLYSLLKKIKETVDFEAVSVGAILSEYQTLRVLNVCQRLGIQALAYLWQRNQAELLQEMVSVKIDAILIKVAALGLCPEKHLGHSIASLLDYLIALEGKFGCNPCGEGGEYETLTLDCPLFSHRLVIDESQTVIVNSDSVLTVAHLNPTKIHLEEKAGFNPGLSQKEMIRPFSDVLEKALQKRNPVEFPQTADP